MKVLLSWLREMAPVEAEPAELADVLTMRGVVLETLTEIGRGISGVVVGEVREMRNHPNADSLMLVKAADGEGVRDIVCGARNYVVGDRVPLALPGARLPGGMEIAQRTVRGEVSDGMLCSARELEIADDHSGILLLDRDAPLGADVVEHLRLRDHLLDFDITPNRPDLLSVAGIAREIAAAYRLPLTLPAADLVETGPPVATLAEVEISDRRGCPRYLARVIEGVRTGASPWWMRWRLLAAGVRPISNIVDVTNYVLLERGHPLHAFDLDRLSGAKIVVRKAKRGEAIVTLDGRERALASGDVMICDAEGPVALAGIMGGATSEVADGTTRVLLESAYFDPLRIRPTSARLGLRTEASVRFERGADPEVVGVAADRAASLLASLAGGRVATGAIDVYPSPVRVKPVRLRVTRATELIGAPQQAGPVTDWLTDLGCTVEGTGSTLKVLPPSWRPDLRLEEDLVEEVARCFGYDRVPETLPAGGRVGGLDERQRVRRAVRQILLGVGLNEAVSLSLLPAWLPERLGLPEEHLMHSAAALANPLSEEESRLRVGLLPGLLFSAERNVARRVLPVRLFEQGIVFEPAGKDDPPVESEQVAWLLTGPAETGLHAAERALGFADAKGVLEALLDGLGIAAWEVADAREISVLGALHPARRALVSVDGRPAGYVAELHPRVCDLFGLPVPAAIGQLDLETLASAVRPARGVEPPRLPAVERDIAVIVPDEVPHAAVQATIAGAAGPLLEQVRLFDLYRGAPVPAGSVSLAYRLTLRDAERTLSDGDADEVMTTVNGAVTSAGWSIRA